MLRLISEVVSNTTLLRICKFPKKLLRQMCLKFETELLYKKQPLKQLFFKKGKLTKRMQKFGQFIKKLHFCRLLQIEGRNIFRPQSNITKASCWMYDWVLRLSPEGFVQCSMRGTKPLLLFQSLQQHLLGKSISNKLAASSTTDTLLKTQIIVDFFPIESYEHAVLQNGAAHCSFRRPL